MVGHRGVILKRLGMGDTLLPISQFTSTAVHPDARGRGLYTRIHQRSIEISDERKASLMFSTTSTAGITRVHNLRTGFVELPRTRYVRILRPERVLQHQLRLLAQSSPGFRRFLQSMASRLRFKIDDVAFSAAEVLGIASSPSWQRITLRLSPTGLSPLVSSRRRGILGLGTTLLILMATLRLTLWARPPWLLGMLLWEGVKLLVRRNR